MCLLIFQRSASLMYIQ